MVLLRWVSSGYLEKKEKVGMVAVEGAKNGVPNNDRVDRSLKAKRAGGRAEDSNGAGILSSDE